MSDTFKTIKCPACGKEMTKIFVKDAKCYVDICVDGCGGIFFDNKEFEKFDEQHENIDDIVAAYKDKAYIAHNEAKDRICPVCNKVMSKHYVSIKNEVEIDECYSCGGIFLDYGELEAIRNQYETEEDRKDAFLQLFEQQYNIVDFKDYKAKTPDELFNKGGLHLLYNKNTSGIINFISKLF
jgi:hypothetical protein